MDSTKDSLILNIFQSSQTKSVDKKIRKNKNKFNNNNNNNDIRVTQNSQRESDQRLDVLEETKSRTRSRNINRNNEKTKQKSKGFERKSFISSLFQNNPEIPTIRLYDFIISLIFILFLIHFS
jgi:ribosome recycling factor